MMARRKPFIGRPKTRRVKQNCFGEINKDRFAPNPSQLILPKPYASNVTRHSPLLGHRPHAPMRGVSRAVLHGLLDDFEFDRRAEWLLARWLTAALDEAIDVGLDEILPQRQMVFRNSASRMIAMTP
jgi:hypothetical protein